MSRTGWLLNQSQAKKKTESQRCDGDDNANVERLGNWKDLEPFQNNTRDCRVDVERLDCRVDVKIETPEENIKTEG